MPENRHTLPCWLPAAASSDAAAAMEEQVLEEKKNPLRVGAPVIEPEARQALLPDNVPYHLYMVRHGQSLGNQLDLMAGWSDVGLTEAGREGLKALRRILPYPKADRVYYSGLRRTRETLAIIQPERLADAVVDWRFSEGWFGLIEGRSLDDEEHHRFFMNFYQDIPQGYGEETFSDQVMRVVRACVEALDDLKDYGQHTAMIFGHYGSIKSAYAAFNDIQDPACIYNFDIPNGSLWDFAFRPDPQGRFHCVLIRAYRAGQPPETFRNLES